MPQSDFFISFYNGDFQDVVARLNLELPLGIFDVIPFRKLNLNPLTFFPALRIIAGRKDFCCVLFNFLGVNMTFIMIKWAHLPGSDLPLIFIIHSFPSIFFVMYYD